MKVIWTRPALRELEAIADFIARQNPWAAERVTGRVLARAATLSDQPHIGRPGRIAGTRELVVTGTPFIVPYRIRDDQVEILSVFHGARRWPSDFP
jgi:toxin ParE1/3/4